MVATSLASQRVGLTIIVAAIMAGIGLQVQLFAETAGSDYEAKTRLKELAPIVKVGELDTKSGQYLVQLAAAQLEYLQSSQRIDVFDLELTHQREGLIEVYDECARGTMRLELSVSPVIRETDGVSTVRSELDATSLVDAISYWNCSSGHSYLDLQTSLLQRGVAIRRVFIERPESLSDLREVVRTHMRWRDSGLNADVRIAFINEVPPDLLVDYAIVDSNTVIRLESQRGVPVAVVWETAPQAVERRKQAFRRLWNMAKDPKDLPEFK